MNLWLPLAVGAISFTLSKSTMPLVRRVREWLSGKSEVLGDLLHCPYCTSNWVALVVMALYRPLVIHSAYPVADWFFSWQALVGAAMIPVFGIYFVASK